jgi:hypothetical protein
MEAMRQSWSDDRLDDLNRRVDDGFNRVDAQFARVDRQFARVDRQFAELRAEMNLRFDHGEARFDSLQQTMIRIGAGMIGTLIATCGGVIATQL